MLPMLVSYRLACLLSKRISGAEMESIKEEFEKHSAANAKVIEELQTSLAEQQQLAASSSAKCEELTREVEKYKQEIDEMAKEAEQEDRAHTERVEALQKEVTALKDQLSDQVLS